MIAVLGEGRPRLGAARRRAEEIMMVHLGGQQGQGQVQAVQKPGEERAAELMGMLPLCRQPQRSLHIRVCGRVADMSLKAV